MSTLADDVAALQAEITRWAQQGDTRYGDCMAILDRIAARAPQRAMDIDGDLCWQHTCGAVRYGDGDAMPDTCPRMSCFLPGTWRPLYVLPDGA